MELEKQQTQFISRITEKARSAQYEAFKAVNAKLINLHWEIGKSITEKQKDGENKDFLQKLSLELQKDFPGKLIFSTRNLRMMARFYSEYHTATNIMSLAEEISWSNHLVILNSCKDNKQREFYMREAKKFCWTEDMLTKQIENKAFENSFDTLPYM